MNLKNKPEVKNLIIYILLFWIIGITNVHLHAQNVAFSNLTTEDGLSQFSVNSLYIDENGMLWIGTREGLNRYNGTDIQTYKLEKDNPYSLFSNTVIRITGDKKGKIFLLCNDGVAQLDLRTQKFKTLLVDNIHSIYYNKGLYIAKKNEIYLYNESTGNFDLYYQLAGNTPEIRCMHSGNGSLWMGTIGDGVYRLQLDSMALSHPIKEGNITSIYEDSDGELWIGSWENGLYNICTDGSIRNFKYDANNPHSISSNFVRACCEDNLGNIWIGTFNGLNRYNKSNGLFQNHTANDVRADGLTHSSIWCIVKDQQGTLWLGTYFGGVNYFNPEYNIYTAYHYSSVEKKGLSNPVVGRIVEDKNGDLWIGTEGGGLNYLDRRKNEFRWYRSNKNNTNSIAHDNVKALYYDAALEEIWIGTHLGGLDRLNIRTGRFTHHRMEEGNPETLPSNIVRDIEPYGKDSLVVATQNGVCIIHKYTGKCHRLFQHSKEGRNIRMVADVEFDQEGNLWIAATGEGVFRYNLQTNELKNYRWNSHEANCLSNNNVYSILCDKQGNLWFATSGSGLDLYCPQNDNFVNFDQAHHGLVSDCIYEAQESPVSGHLLLITNQGFSIFDRHTLKAQNYNIDNGFPFSAINENALCVTRDGEIFLGSTKGMISFHEMELHFPQKPYSITLSKLYVNGKEVRVDDENGILSQALSYTPEITLKADQSMFTIEFATSNYVAANKDEIVYRLRGFSDKWTQARTGNAITYTNLNAGNYTLEIKPKDQSADICAPVHLKIHVLPPFYKTVWAYLIYILSVGSLLWYLIRAYKMRFKLRESLKYEKKHAQDIELLNQSKLRFFTNISHEFRTPLTLIISQVETLLQVQNFTPTLYNKVLSIYKNSIQLRELITELLDFRKQEQGHMKIKVASHNIVSFLYENYLLFLEYASTHQIHFDFKQEVETLDVWYDQKQMQKVVNNLLSNAMKHTKAEDSITLSVSRDEKNAIIRVTDTGEGIDAKEVDKIFDRFYQIDPIDVQDANKSTGTGIGLALTKGIVELHHGYIRVESELGKGTSFIVTIPLGNAHFSKEQIDLRDNSIQQPDVNKAEMDMMLKTELEEDAPIKRMADVKMLVVEDNDSIREILSNIFAPFYRVVTASNGQEAWELIGKEQPNIVVSDVVMPLMSGTELCKRIKSDFNTCHIPVVLLTARTAIEQNIEGLRIGADDYITKPFNTSLLISRCNNLVNSRILLQEKFSKQPQAQAQLLATNPIDKEILDRAMEVIEHHLDDPDFNVNTFAREMAMARTNLFSKIKAITGQTPNDFILTIRLKKGALMLRNNPELNITEISDRIGFSSPRYFSKCFKDVYQVSPLAYRKGDSAGNETVE